MAKYPTHTLQSNIHKKNRNTLLTYLYRIGLEDNWDGLFVKQMSLETTICMERAKVILQRYYQLCPTAIHSCWKAYFIGPFKKLTFFLKIQIA